MTPRDHKKKRITYRRSFEIEPDKNIEKYLNYFVGQELAYYNHVVSNLSPRLRAFPQDFLSFKDREKRLLEVCAENIVNIQKMIDYKQEEWPANLREYYSLLREPDGTLKLSQAHIDMIKVVGSPAKLHGKVRKNIATEILNTMTNQAEILFSSLKSDTLKVPLQTLQTHQLETKRHIQIPANLLTIEFNSELDQTEITIPYAPTPLIIKGYNLKEIQFKSAVIRAPHPSNREAGWIIDLKDSANYLVSLTDHNEKKRKKQYS